MFTLYIPIFSTLYSRDLETEKEQIRELIQIHLDYEDELSEHWEEIVCNVEGEYIFE